MTQIAITGADGFLGRSVLKAAHLRGERALALVRTPPGMSDLPARVADLRDADAVHGILDDVDVLVHLAAAKKGGFHDQYPSTVKATEILLAEAETSGVRRVVLVSSIAVFDYMTLRSGSVVSDDGPVDHTGVGRDAYTQTKILQEDLARRWAVRSGVELVIARPGVVFGPESWWTYRIGERFGKYWVCFGNQAQVPLTFVDNCADALIHLATTPGVSGAYNILDDDPPSQKEYRKMVAKRLSPSPLRLVVPWPVASGVVRLLSAANQRRAEPLHLPGFLVPASLAVRAKPLRYTNRRLRETGWAPLTPLDDALAATFADQP